MSILENFIFSLFFIVYGVTFPGQLFILMCMVGPYFSVAYVFLWLWIMREIYRNHMVLRN